MSLFRELIASLATRQHCPYAQKTLEVLAVQSDQDTAMNCLGQDEVHSVNDT